MSDAGIVALCTFGAAVVAGIPGIIAAIKATRAVEQGKANGAKVDEVAGQVEEAKVAAKETSVKQDAIGVKQDAMSKQQDEIHTATNSELHSVKEELKQTKQAFIAELTESKQELKELRAAVMEMAKQSVPQVPATQGVALDKSIPIPLPVTVVKPADMPKK